MGEPLIVIWMIAITVTVAANVAHNWITHEKVELMRARLDEVITELVDKH